MPEAKSFFSRGFDLVKGFFFAGASHDTSKLKSQESFIKQVLDESIIFDKKYADEKMLTQDQRS